LLEDLSRKKYETPQEEKKAAAELREHKLKEQELAKLLREIKGQIEIEEEGGGFGGVKEVKEDSSKGSTQKVDLKMGKPFNADRDTRIPFIGLPNFKMGEVL
jgi:hypothetical protein